MLSSNVCVLTLTVQLPLCSQHVSVNCEDCTVPEYELRRQYCCFNSSHTTVKLLQSLNLGSYSLLLLQLLAHNCKTIAEFEPR